MTKLQSSSLNPGTLICVILMFPIWASGLIQIRKDTSNRHQEISFGGLVRTDAAFDTRMNVESREGFFIFYPLSPASDPNGTDIHARPGFNQWAMTTRLWIKADGPEIGNAQTAAFAEGDFTGPSNIENNALRLRHAYITFTWEKRKLLVGQY